MFLHARCDGQDVGVKNYIVGIKARLLNQQVVSALTDANFVFFGCGLSFFVEGHHHYCGTVPAAKAGVLEKSCFAFLEANGIHDAFALHALESRLNDRPFGAVDHDGHSGDGRFGSNKVEELRHAGLGIKQALIKIHIDYIGTVFNLLSGNRERAIPVIVGDHLLKARGSRHIAPLTDHDKTVPNGMVQGFESAETLPFGKLGNGAGRAFADFLHHRADVVGGRATATTDEIDESILGKAADRLAGVFRGFVITRGSKWIGESCVWIHMHVAIGHAGEILQEGPHEIRAEGTV